MSWMCSTFLEENVTQDHDTNEYLHASEHAKILIRGWVGSDSKKFMDMDTWAVMGPIFLGSLPPMCAPINSFAYQNHQRWNAKEFMGALHGHTILAVQFSNFGH